MKNKIKLQYGKRYLFEERLLWDYWFYDAKVVDFAQPKLQYTENEVPWKLVKLKRDDGTTTWAEVNKLKIAEEMDKDCE